MSNLLDLNADNRSNFQNVFQCLIFSDEYTRKIIDCRFHGREFIPRSRFDSVMVEEIEKALLDDEVLTKDEDGKINTVYSGIKLTPNFFSIDELAVYMKNSVSCISKKTIDSLVENLSTNKEVNLVRYWNINTRMNRESFVAFREKFSGLIYEFVDTYDDDGEDVDLALLMVQER